MELSTLIILFVFGVIIGSFLNVISLRYKPGQHLLDVKIIGGRSQCSTCKSVLRWYELVPLFSFFVQKMKCRHCAHALSWQYPIVEFVSGLLTVALPAFLFSFFNFNIHIIQGGSLLWFYSFIGLWLLATYTFIVIAIVDLRHRIIPDQANILLAVFGLGILLIKSTYSANFQFFGSFFKSYAAVFSISSGLLVNTGMALLTALVIYGGIILLTSGRGMGLGDLKLALPIALFLGWPDVLLAFSASFIVGAVFAIPLLLHKVKKINDAIPFGPFIIIGVYVTIFYGYQFAQWYFGLI
ncbi:MAG: hypothetical protein COU10_01520 [Candidatus Harrisonbacteria bacterium CG10_big_fil_rev_8_21_14_0_10_45_28]|uniref:Prepilin peptidase n=1 Tax=Candidatus Harrisonbacteria bacterium CG10_big_fil_rev_8_21_14_0_10_45_28 TaxID=1974586 RepID=A0A2H0UNM7_9BACT|nr:MAG: hypothetical protein COU10_01520 [Candidatus Harrisonbacteria bacterium CG10_big_fil_rev_8_21_14_0_10_45_28]